MANQITDNRTLLTAADVLASHITLTGAGLATAQLETDTVIEGVASLGNNVTNSRIGVLFDAGSVQTSWANSTFYIWLNCGIVPILDTKANGGTTVRFAGATITDWFEFDVGGSDSWPVTVAGGWALFVVDIEGTPSRTNGTPPATNACQYFGFSAVTATIMTKMVLNMWMDECRFLPANTPGIVIEGRNGGITDWDSADIASQLGASNGTFKLGAGGEYAMNTPIQIGINDTTIHGFTETNKTWVWEDQEFAPPDLYGISALGNSGGTTNVTLGVKTGTGNNATGAQGLIIQAADVGVRWSMDFNDPNLDSVGLYGCTFNHGSDLLLDDITVSCISTSYIDCTSALITGSEQLRISVVAPNTADGVAFMSTDDISDIVFSSFEFLDGHAIEILSGGPAIQSDIGNVFIGAYGGVPGDNLVANSGSTDAMIYNNSTAAKTINGSDGATTPSFRNGLTATSNYENNVSITITDLVVGSVVSVYLTGTSTLVSETLNSGTTYIFSVGASVSVDIVILEGGEDDPNASIPVRKENLSFAVSQSLASGQLDNPNFKG